MAGIEIKDIKLKEREEGATLLAVGAEGQPGRISQPAEGIYRLARGALKGRVGWRQYPASFPFVLAEENKRAASGRYFQDFSAFVTLYNVKEAMEDTDADEVSFNIFLMDRQNAAIATFLSAVSSPVPLRWDKRGLFNEAIIKEAGYGLFDEGIGLQTASSLIEMMYVTARSNTNARLTKDLAGDFVRELNGMHIRDGVAEVAGLRNRLVSEIKSLQRYFFPRANPV
jgi:hypothetical protein